MMGWPVFLTVPRAPDFVVGDEDDVYLRRWWIVPHNRWFNVYLHNFCRSDDDRALHDHPWVNVSVVLSGGYNEHTANRIYLRKPWRPWAPWRVTIRTARAAHRVELLPGGAPVWTIFITGPKTREWGFLCPQGWRHWRDFVSLRPGGNSVGRGCE